MEPETEPEPEINVHGCYLQCGIAFGAQRHAGNGMYNGQETIEGHQHKRVDTANGEHGQYVYVCVCVRISLTCSGM